MDNLSLCPENDPLPIEEYRDLMKKIPVFNDKIIVNMVNSLEVAGDHIRVRSSRCGIFSRFMDSITGKGAKWQAMTDRALHKGLEGAVTWIQKLQAEQIHTDRALTLVTEKLAETRTGICRLVDSHMELKSEVEQIRFEMDHFIESAETRLAVISEEITRIGLRQSAMIHMQRVFDKWQAGHFDAFPPAVQLFLTLQELFWTPFGRYHASNPEFEEQVRDKCLIRMNDMTNGSCKEHLPIESWLLPVQAQTKPVNREVIAFLADAGDMGKRTPFCHAISSAASLPCNSPLDQWIQEHGSSRLNRIISAERLIGKIIQELSVLQANREWDINE